jgi:nitric oxide reductase NorQ protein
MRRNGWAPRYGATLGTGAGPQRDIDLNTNIASLRARVLQPEARLIEDEPYFQPLRDEITLFEAAYASRLPVLLKGPTGCGKTRFVEHRAWRLKRPLITVSCHDDLTASDLVGRYLITNHETVWVDGPLARAVRAGAICYLDEVVEARKDTTVVIHPLADERRILPMEKRGELLQAPPEFMLALSYNPGYQNVMKELKQSTRQRFIAIEFAYPDAALEAKIVIAESGIDAADADKLVRLAHMTRNLKGSGLDEGASTRLLVHAAKLMRLGVAPRTACRGAIADALTDDEDMLSAVNELASSLF